MNSTLTLTTDTATRSTLAPLTRYLPSVARCALGFIFLVSGLNGFLNFLPPPDTSAMPEGAMQLGAAFMKSGYLFPLILGTEALTGALLLSNRFVPLALTLLAPVLVNILAFHLFLAPTGLGLAVALVAIELYLSWVHRAAFRPMLAARIGDLQR